MLLVCVLYRVRMPDHAPVPLMSGAKGKDLVEREVRNEITSGSMAPRYRLVESELSERYHVSRGSVRLALDALTAEGLVERIPNKGARVRAVSLDEAVEIMETRMVLDGLMSRKAAEAATEDQRAALKANLVAMEEQVAAGELLSYTDLIQQHHHLVHAAARQPIVESLLERLQAQIGRHQFRLSLRPERARQSLEELRGVVDAIAAGDPDRAEAAGRQHFLATVEALKFEAASS